VLDRRTVELEVRRNAPDDEFGARTRSHMPRKVAQEVPASDVGGGRDLALEECVDVIVEPSVTVATRQAGHSGEAAETGGLEVIVTIGRRPAVAE